jgi:hypothetical protein
VVRRRALQAICTAMLLAVMVDGWISNTAKGRLGYDCHAYWLTAHRAVLYSGAPASRDAYLYSPLFAQLIRPLTLLPWLAFVVVWQAMLAAVFVWLLRPIRLGWRIPVLLLCVPDVFLGNINALLALALVIGMRRPGAWAFPLLTKIAPGLIGLGWFASRGEWRRLGRALARTAVLIACSVAFGRGAWLSWLRFLVAHSHQDGNAWGAVHFAAAAGFFVAARITRRAWLLAPAMALASPVLTFYSPLAILTAIPRLRRAPLRVAARVEPSGAALLAPNGADPIGD